MSRNERITENFVREHFKNDPLFDVIKFEEQKSKSNRIIEILKNASKSGKGIGKPEFIITFPSQNINYLIVVECKAIVDEHESLNLNNPKKFAVDGVLHYSKILSKDYTVIGIAVSGEVGDELKISNFKWENGAEIYEDLKTNKLLTISDYLRVFNNDVFTENLKNIDIVQKAIYLNEQFHSYSITENGRCTIVSAILLSLLDNTFKSSYITYENTSDLADGMLEALKRVLNRKGEDNKALIRNKDSMIMEFNKIKNEPIFKQQTIKHKKDEELTIRVVKEDFISYLHKNVFPLITMEDAGIDILGKFYTEFIRYAGSSQKQGLVLTPFHITDLFCDLANITQDSVVYDPCCGSGGFLISAMKRMIQLAGNDYSKRDHIKKHQLVGVERRADMFSYACTNMMFRGDGKSNIYNGDCFNISNTVKNNHAIDTVFLNPPYDVGNAGQMSFVEHGLKMVSKTNGIVVAIVQVSCAIKNEKDLINIKERLLQNHRLLAVISMPNELFSPVGVITVTMVFQANIPNNGFETWFGYLKDDGFEKRKHKGRLDLRKRWDDIRKNFIDAYKNSREVTGMSVKKSVTAKDEWLAEAYMETDYSRLDSNDFISELRKYVSYNVLNQ